ncbi:MAG: TapB family protein [Planctomycetota bacterium]
MSRDFFPLAAGNSWTYRVKSDGRDLGTESIRVTERLSSSSDYGLPRAGADADEAGRGPRRRRRKRAEFFRVLEPGGRSVWGSDRGTIVRSSGSARSVVLLHPPFVGSGWTDEGPAPPGRRSTQVVYCKVITREAVQTPAGWFFDCVVVRREAEDRSSVVTQWFAADVGLVRWRVEQPGKSDVEWGLEKYVVKRE